MKRKCTLLLTIFLASAIFIHAQNTAHEIEALLETSAVTYSQAARFVLEASSQAILNDRDEAFEFARNGGFLPANVTQDSIARLDGISYLLLNCFGLKGGAMYTMTRSPHYAYRELVHKNIIQGRVLGSMPVSGDMLLFITGRMLLHMETISEN